MRFVIGGYAQGKRVFAESIAAGEEIIDNYHEKIREQSEAGLDPFLELRSLLDASGDIIIISNEVGMGIVPMEQKERDYRDMVGKVHIEIATLADEVYQVTCGIGRRIK